MAAAAQQVADAVGAAGLQGLLNKAGVIVHGPLVLVPVHALPQGVRDRLLMRNVGLEPEAFEANGTARETAGAGT